MVTLTHTHTQTKYCNPRAHAPSVNKPMLPHSASCAWEDRLRAHPDGDFIQYLLSGMQNGFRIGFDYSQFSCGKGKHNMRSATQNADVVENYRKKECSLGPLQEGLPGSTSMSTGLASSQSRISREGEAHCGLVRSQWGKCQ